MENKNMGFGLLPTPKDERDFSLGGVFGTIPLEDVPLTDWVVAEPLKIKDQGQTDYCTGYATTSVSEDQEELELDPEYQFAKAKQIQGEWQSWGAHLRDAAKSVVKFGSIPTQGIRPTGDPRNWNNWPSDADAVATIHRKESFFAVTGPYDAFDNIRAALWKFRDEKRTLVAGTLWRPSWTHAEGGIIPKKVTIEDVTGNIFGHAIKLLGQKMIDGEPYLVVQNSWGESYGDKGLYYFPREVVNREFGPYGQFMFSDMPKEEAQYLNENNIKIDDSWLIALVKAFITLIKKLWR